MVAQSSGSQLRVEPAALPRRIAMLVTLCAYLSACTSWKTQSVAPEQVFLTKQPKQVRVTRADQSRLVLVNPEITGDSLVGELPGSGKQGQPSRRAGVPLAEVKQVAIQGVDAGKTILLGVGLGVTALVVIAAATYDSPSLVDDNHPAVSCPLVYSWDGEGWRLDSGTFGGAIAAALARTDVDNLLYATAQAGWLRLRVANELDETDYLDGLSVLAVDHDPEVTVAPDADGGIHTLEALTPVADARDFRGADALARVRVRDGWSWESNPTRRDTALAADIRDGIELVFAKPPAVGFARLVVDGHNTPWAAHLTQEFVHAHGRATQAWYDSLASSPEMAHRLGSMMAREGFLKASVRTAEGWEPQGFIWEAGPEIVKRQVLPLDLSRVPGDSVRIRLESAPSFWLIDYAAIDYSVPRPITVHHIALDSATDGEGRNVGDLIKSEDGRHYIMTNGEAAELAFRVPPVPAGRARSYLLRSTGWYRIHGPEMKEPDLPLLDAIVNAERGASRVAVARLNDALAVLHRSRP